MNVDQYVYKEKIKRSRKNIKKTYRCFERYHWRFKITGIDDLKSNIESLMHEISIPKRDPNYKKVLLTLHKYSSETNEILQLFFTLEDLKKFNMLTKNAEQLVINRANYIFTEMLRKMQQ